MADINMSIALDLNSIVTLTTLSQDVNQTTKLDNKYVHLLALNKGFFHDYSGTTASISGAKAGDRVNLAVVNYSEYDSALSAVLVNYTLVNSQFSVKNPNSVSDSVKRLIIDDTTNLDNNTRFNDVNLYYWTSSILKLGVTERYKGLLKIYIREEFLGYASFEQSITFMG
ncbi:AidA/PixA family protein [Xenorhabdus bovienii]|uniref:AidA/PixA family protein n=1 Tax=Xenorhabdus bovienii TaxID=40576 RepID=UPI0023B2F107|nr:AidA/PixA family protein [Xenorhabdus bovienii]MDE9467582.1 inclusion body family protein [Xenorhabdus bovienii]